MHHAEGNRATGEPSWIPISRATVQLWGLEQVKHSVADGRARRRPLRAVVRWVAATLRH